MESIFLNFSAKFFKTSSWLYVSTRNRNVCAIHLSMAAGVTAKDKRTKDAKNQMMATPQFKKKRFAMMDGSMTGEIEGRVITCDALPERPLPPSMSLAHVLGMMEAEGLTADWPCVHLTIRQKKGAFIVLSLFYYSHQTFRILDHQR